MQALRDSRPRFKGAVTKIATKLDNLKADDASEIAHLDLSFINTQLLSLERTEKRFQVNIQDTQEYAPEDGEEFEVFQEEEDASADAFEQVMFKTKEKAQHLLALKKIQSGLADLNHKTETLEASLSTRPDADHSSSYHVVEANFTLLNDEWREANLPRDHALKKELEAFTGRLHYLATDISSAKLRSIPTPISTTSVALKTEPDRVCYNPLADLPTIKIPTFSGDILEWSTFWAAFRSSVDSRTELKNTQKLQYLRQAIKDPDLQPLLHSPLETEDMYINVITELKERFNKTREIHAHLTKAVLELSTPKQTRIDLRRSVDSFKRTMDTLKQTEHYNLDAFLSSRYYLALPSKLQILWDQHTKKEKGVPPISKLLQFVKDHAETLPAVAHSQPSNAAPEKKPQAKQQGKPYHQKPKGQVYSVSNPTPAPAAAPASAPRSTFTSFKYECPLCKPEKHHLSSCPKWLGFSVDQRLTQVKDRKLCSNCLAPGHVTKDCTNTYRCRDCHQKHHTTIHKDNNVQVSSTFSQSRQLPDALLMTAHVLLKGPGGHQMKARAFLDPGAGLSLVSGRVAQILELPLEPSKTSFTTVQGTKCLGSNHLTTLTISSLNNKREFSCRPAVVKQVTEDIPNKLLETVDNYQHLNGLFLADPTFNVPGRIDILLGAELWPQLQETSSPNINGELSEPGAQLTAFGWVLSGPIQAQEESTRTITTGHVQPMTNDELYNLAHEFWLAESAEPPETTMSSVNEQVEHHYQETVKYSPTELRYQVSLPRKPDCLPLGVSKPQAVKRYFSNEASISRRGMEEVFQAQIQGYLDAGHAEPVPTSDIDLPNFYLPMHSVVKESSTSTKLRIVFDGSAVSSTGVSLNHLLQVGPTLHPPLADILMKFRSYPVALTADVSKMYREVELNPVDRDLHRFVWRPTLQDELQDFRMTRVTFGVSASPYLAIKTLQQTAKDHGADYPTASKHITSSFYVDDLLAGAQTPEEAKQLFTQLRAILHKGGFNLCKWRSSDSTVLKSIPTDLQEKLLTKDATTMQASAQPKALGLQWDSKEDAMSPSIHTPSSYRQTKRGIISDVSKTFDVLGWIAPAVLPMKVMYQTLWEKGQEWDGLAPPHVIEEHRKWRQQLPCLSKKKLQRCYISHPQPVRQELHGFSDASKKAAGAVVYIRTTYQSHKPTVSLVSAKTKVAKRDIPKNTKKTRKAAKDNPQPPPEPTESDSSDEDNQPKKAKPPSDNNAPRTELVAAVLLTKLLNNISTVLEIPLENITAWTDSSTVWAWLDGRHRDHDRFVANRVNYILEHTKPSTWKHVPGTDNPADCASRGMDPEKLLHHTLWWQGPPWLYDNPVTVPTQPPRKPIEEVIRPVHHTVPLSDFTSQLLIRTNNYQTLICMTAWCLRFIKRIKEGQPSPDERVLDLDPEEREAAEHLLLKHSQLRSFPGEYHSLASKNKTNPTSRIRDLTPQMTPKEGLIRVGGRLDHSELPFSQQHPIILDGKDELIIKMFEFLHIKHGHSGPSQLLSKTSKEVYVVGARRLSRTVCSKCRKCRRVQPQPIPQLMGELPPDRTKANQPVFTNVGLDFAGPYTIRYGRGKSRTQAYICIFICMATKAVHIEITPDMKTPAFIRCLQRFISRRNCPASLHCDNGSNFVGARRDLEAFYTTLAEEDVDETIRHFLLRNKINWKHIPARSPHFGGLWEGAVRSMKKHLRRIMGPIIFTYEELETITCQVEACLNSRPLLPLTCHNSDGIVPLTPGHFIFLNAPNAYPVDPTLPPEPSLLKRYNQCQAVVHHFWDRWSREYLHTLQSRTKWQQIKPNLQTGDVVIYRPKDNFACRWPIARVIKTYPGDDGLVRTVLIKPPYTEAKKRPVTKLSLVHREEETLPKTTTNVVSPGRMFRQEGLTPEQQTETSPNAARQPSEKADSESPAAGKPPIAARRPSRRSQPRPQRRSQPPRACNKQASTSST